MQHLVQCHTVAELLRMDNGQDGRDKGISGLHVVEEAKTGVAIGRGKRTRDDWLMAMQRLKTCYDHKLCSKWKELTERPTGKSTGENTGIPSGGASPCGCLKSPSRLRQLPFSSGRNGLFSRN